MTPEPSTPSAPIRLPPHLRPILRVLKRYKWPTAFTFVREGAANPFAVTARIRDLRKAPYNFIIETKRFDGLYHYHLSK